MLHVHPSRAQAGAAAAAQATFLLRRALANQPTARVVFAAAPSQIEMLAALREAPGLDWSRVTAFHLDEYMGLPPDAPELFSRFLRREIWDAVGPGRVHVIDPAADPSDYAALLAEAPIDLVLLGIGENGHLAFNDPPVADFHDPLAVKVVELDETCRRQQVNDGCFAALADVPHRAVTLTLPTLLSGRHLIVTVPGASKRAALRATLAGPISPACPASALRLHPSCSLHVDQEAYR